MVRQRCTNILTLKLIRLVLVYDFKANMQATLVIYSWGEKKMSL